MAAQAASETVQAKPGSQPSRRRTAATLPELQARAAFRACDRLMEHGANNETQLWSVARVMCGEEFEQAAEERALAGKCGNPLCSQPPHPPQEQGRGRYRVSTVQQMVFERDSADEEPIYCSPECESSTKRFAARLGSAALALERFTGMYQLVQQNKQQQQHAQQHVEGEQLAQSEGAASVQSTVETASSLPAAAAAAAPAGLPATHRDSLPGGIKSSAALVPRLAVEQVEVKHIDSSAGQFGDFSRKAKPRATANGAPQPKGVLKKQSQFAAGTARVPIMLAEVKEREPSMVAAETAQGRQPSRGPSTKAAAAVEGYVPRASTSRRQRQQRRVRFTDDASEVSAAGKAPGGSGGDILGSHVDSAATVSVEDRAAPSSVETSEVVLPASSVLVFEVEQPTSAPSKGAAEGLSAQFGCLRVADAAQQPAAAAVPAGSSPNPAPIPTPPVPASADARSGSVDIKHRSHGSSSGIPGATALPREWREVPQFYAHSPVGSSSSLAGSLVSPVGSSSNLASIAVSSPPAQAFLPRQRYSSPPPGLPRAPTSQLASPQQTPVQQQQRPLQQEEQQQQQQQQPHQQQPMNGECTTVFASSTSSGAHGAQAQQGQAVPAAEQLGLTKQQAGQLQRAFPALSAVLPPELQAALASDSESASEGDDSEGWMESDEDEEAAGGSSDDEALSPSSSSSYRVQLSFFGTLFTHLEAWITPETVELLASGPDVDVVLPPPGSPEVLAVLSRCLSVALTPVLAGLQVAAARGQVERCLDELLRTFRLVGPLPAVKVPQWQVVAILFLKALSLERCPSLREAFETRAGIGRLNRLLASLSFTCEEYWALLELLCPAE